MARVAELSYYPVKGCAAVSAREALLTPAGPAHDRSFMVVSEAGGYRTQRRDPRLALIRPAISDDGQRLTLRAPHADCLHLPVATRAPADRWICSGPPTRASTRVTRSPNGSRTSWAHPAAWCVCRRTTGG